MPVVWDRRLHLVWPIFHLESEQQSSQTVPSTFGGTTSTPPTKFWAVEFAMSEFSAAQWQPKQTYDQRMFIINNNIFGDALSRPPKAFTLKAYQDNSFNLQLEVYYTLTGFDLGPITLYRPGETVLIGTGTLALPDAPLQVTQDPIPSTCQRTR